MIILLFQKKIIRKAWIEDYISLFTRLISHLMIVWCQCMIFLLFLNN
jgi:hypothetical protein